MFKLYTNQMKSQTKKAPVQLLNATLQVKLECMAKSQKQLNKRRAFRRIDFRERVIIENRYCADRKKIGEIAKELGRPISAINREIGDRPRVGRGEYSADKAQGGVKLRRKNQGRKSKFNYEPLKKYMINKLKLGWSPEQISIRLPIEYPSDKKMRVSYEAIYKHIYSQIYRHGNGQVKPECEDLRILKTWALKISILGQLKVNLVCLVSSLIQTARMSEAQIKIPTDCCASISPRGLILEKSQITKCPRSNT